MTVLAHYTLRRKDIPLVHFCLEAEQEVTAGMAQTIYQVHVTQVEEDNRHLLPGTLREQLTDASLLTWIDRRKAPKNRQFVDQIMYAIADDENPLRYVDISHALSLNDAFWITNDEVPSLWKNFNLYSHPFDEVLAYVAFTGYSQKISGVLSSPELTSSGALKKCWSNRKDGIYLIKGDDFIKTEDGRSQATMEFYAAQIAEKMGFAHIPYELEEFHHRDGEKEIVCTCKLFTSEDVGFVNAYDFFLDKGIDVEREDLSRFKIQEQMANVYGNAAYQDLMVFDALICNRDRHLGNFGYLVDNNTGEYLSPAPIFDNGFALLYGAARGNLSNISAYIETLEGKYLPFDQQTRLFIQPRHAPRIRRLLNFEFKKHPCYNVSDECLAKMSEMIQFRARHILSIYQEKKDVTRTIGNNSFIKNEHIQNKTFNSIDTTCP